MENDLWREFPVFNRRLAVAAVAAILRQPTPMLLVRLLESVEANKRQQQLIVCLFHLALEHVLRIQVHATLHAVKPTFIANLMLLQALSITSF